MAFSIAFCPEDTLQDVTLEAGVTSCDDGNCSRAIVIPDGCYREQKVHNPSVVADDFNFTLTRLRDRYRYRPQG